MNRILLFLVFNVFINLNFLKKHQLVYFQAEQLKKKAEFFNINFNLKVEKNITITSVICSHQNKDILFMIEKLEKKCNKTDGEQSEKYYQITKELFTNHAKYFFLYLKKHTNSCLEKRFTEALSAEISVYDKIDRANQIEKVRNRLRKQIKLNKLEKENLLLVERIIKNLKPEIFD
jgi:polyribonucleotide nucleotidyltransferase